MILLYLPQEHSKRLCPLSQSHYQLAELRVVGRAAEHPNQDLWCQVELIGAVAARLGTALGWP